MVAGLLFFIASIFISVGALFAFDPTLFSRHMLRDNRRLELEDNASLADSTLPSFETPALLRTPAASAVPAVFPELAVVDQSFSRSYDQELELLLSSVPHHLRQSSSESWFCDAPWDEAGDDTEWLNDNSEEEFWEYASASFFFPIRQ